MAEDNGVRMRTVKESCRWYFVKMNNHSVMLIGVVTWYLS